MGFFKIYIYNGRFHNGNFCKISELEEVAVLSRKEDPGGMMAIANWNILFFIPPLPNKPVVFFFFRPKLGERETSFKKKKKKS